jgi:hypothetical protein
LKESKGSKVSFKATGSSGIDTSFGYLRKPMMELVLLVVEITLMMSLLTKLERETIVVGCPYRTGSCRTFCE